MIKAATIRLYHNPHPSEVLALAARAKAKGATHICLVPHVYGHLERGSTNLQYPPRHFHVPGRKPVWDDIGQDPEHPVQNSTATELVEHLALAIEAMGMGVIIKFHFDAYNAAWRFWITFGSLTMLSKFRSAYREKLLRYAKVCKLLINDPILVMGCELPTRLDSAFWIGMVEWLRSPYGGNYQGKVTYAANWGYDFARLAGLWPHLDYAGVDAYEPNLGMFAPPHPTYEQVRAAWDIPQFHWNISPAGDILKVANDAGVELLLTEFGLGNHTLAHRNPGADAPPDAVRDDQLQQYWHEAMRDRFDGEPSFAGYITWDYGLPGMPVAEISHSILDRPAENIAWA
jgi:hypothetical protein